jgi:hypothetical protein
MHSGFMQYLGLFFGDGKIGTAERADQLIVAFVGAINIRSFERCVPDPRFESDLAVRAPAKLLIQISLRTSTLFNPSIFG